MEQHAMDDVRGCRGDEAPADTREHALGSLMASFVPTQPCPRGQCLAGPGDHAAHWHCVMSGVARECAVLSNGRRQIVEFLLPGDFFGLADRNCGDYSVEAVVDRTVVASCPRQRIDTLADTDRGVARLIRDMACTAIARSQGRMLILGRMNAMERVGAFLVEMAERLTVPPGGAMVLPMSRYDIADYLGLSVETVCRAFTGLHDRGAIRISGAHRVKIEDAATLAEAGLAGRRPPRRLPPRRAPRTHL